MREEGCDSFSYLSIITIFSQPIVLSSLSVFPFFPSSSPWQAWSGTRRPRAPGRLGCTCPIGKPGTTGGGAWACRRRWRRLREEARLHNNPRRWWWSLLPPPHAPDLPGDGALVQLRHRPRPLHCLLAHGGRSQPRRPPRRPPRPPPLAARRCCPSGPRPLPPPPPSQPAPSPSHPPRAMAPGPDPASP